MATAGHAAGGGANGGKPKRLPNFKLLHEREQARVNRFKVTTQPTAHARSPAGAQAPKADKRPSCLLRHAPARPPARALCVRVAQPRARLPAAPLCRMRTSASSRGRSPSSCGRITGPSRMTSTAPTATRGRASSAPRPQVGRPLAPSSLLAAAAAAATTAPGCLD